MKRKIIVAKRIDSPSNPVVKETAKLLRKRSTKSGDSFLAEGMNLVEAAMGSPRAWLDKVFYTVEFAEKNARFYRSMGGLGATMYECAPAVIKKLSTEQSPQGIVGVVSLKNSEFTDITGEGPVVISDGIQDPGNMGALIRIADAVGGVGIVLLSGSCDPLMPKALRASAGSAFNLPLVHAKRDETLGALRSLGYLFCAATARKGLPLFESEMPARVAFVFGNEGAGLSEDMDRAARFKVHVPVGGGAESLNVSTSAAVILYEWLRQNTKVAS